MNISSWAAYWNAPSFSFLLFFHPIQLLYHTIFLPFSPPSRIFFFFYIFFVLSQSNIYSPSPLFPAHHFSFYLSRIPILFFFFFSPSIYLFSPSICDSPSLFLPLLIPILFFFFSRFSLLFFPLSVTILLHYLPLSIPVPLFLSPYYAYLNARHNDLTKSLKHSIACSSIRPGVPPFFWCLLFHAPGCGCFPLPLTRQ